MYKTTSSSFDSLYNFDPWSNLIWAWI